MAKKLSKRKVLSAIKDSQGIINKIARKCGCSWLTVKRRIEEDPDLLAAYTEEKERVLDDVESDYISTMLDPSANPFVKIQAQKFYLATVGADRGYVERKSINIVDNRLDELFTKLEEAVKNGTLFPEADKCNQL